MDYKELSTASLVKELREIEGIYPNIDMIKELVSRQDATIEIRKVLEDNNFWKSEWDTSHFDIDSLYALGAIKTNESLECIRYLIKNHEDELHDSDFIIEELPSILANFGSEYFDKIVDIAKDPDNDEYVKFAAFRALSVIVLLNTELKNKLVMISIELLDIGLVGEFPIYCLHDMADLRNEKLFEKVLEFYRRNSIGNDPYHPKEEELMQTYKNIMSFPICRNDIRYPLGYFSPKNWYSNKRYEDMYHFVDDEDDEGDNSNDELEDDTRQADWSNKTYWMDKGKKVYIGRNDKCPCGSTLKYKKCHGKVT